MLGGNHLNLKSGVLFGGRGQVILVGGLSWPDIYTLPSAAAILAETCVALGHDLESVKADLEWSMTTFERFQRLASTESPKYYEVTGTTKAEIDASLDAAEGRIAVVCAKRHFTAVRRAEFQRARPDLVLRLIDNGHQYRCAATGCDCQDDLTIDHIEPLSRGGSDDITNLQFLCRPHNSAKGDRPTASFAQAGF
jgi:hypothetical protein